MATRLLILLALILPPTILGSQSLCGTRGMANATGDACCCVPFEAPAVSCCASGADAPEPPEQVGCPCHPLEQSPTLPTLAEKPQQTGAAVAPSASVRPVVPEARKPDASWTLAVHPRRTCAMLCRWLT